MSDDAQAPGTPQDAVPGPWDRPGDGTDGSPGTPAAGGVPAAQAPGAESGGRIPPGAAAVQAPKVPLDKPAVGPGPESGPLASPADRAPLASPADPATGAPAGPQDTVVSGGAPSVHDQPTVVSLPDSGAPGAPAHPAWSNPFAPPSPGPTPAGPAAGAPSAGNPFAPPAPGAAGNPFAPPAAQAVPPPPMGPEGPGQLSYGYPQYPGYPGYGVPYGPQGPGYGWPGLVPVPSNGMGTASLVLGIISVVVFCLGPVAAVIGVLAVIFGIVGRRKARRGEATNGGMSLAGLICGVVGVVLGILMLIVYITAPASGDDPWSGTDDGYSTSFVTHGLP
jgi:hypothetical protein